jgi:hypothetical protein
MGSAPDFKRRMNKPNPQDKKEAKERSASYGTYGCWKCQLFGMTLYRVGKNNEGQKLYACAAHRALRPA